jgi:F-type H+-transporting ATPase subunit b
MNDLLQQLSELVLDSMPTMALFLGTLLAYRVFVHIPLTKALAERHQRTQGAMESAAAAIATAEARMTEYERKLFAARAAILHAREERLRMLQLESDKATAATRLAARLHVLNAREEMDRSLEQAQVQIQGSIEQLGAQVVARLLSPAGVGAEGVR